MLRTRAAVLRRRQSALSLLRKRTGSSAAQVYQEEHSEDAYPKEGRLHCLTLQLSCYRAVILSGFGGPLWRYTILCSLVAAGAYKYAPEPSDDVYLTRWIAMYTPPRGLWLDLNAKHAALQKDALETTLLLSDAKKAKMHRYRFPQ